jgi:hypothetical protein
VIPSFGVRLVDGKQENQDASGIIAHAEYDRQIRRRQEPYDTARSSILHRSGDMYGRTRFSS